MIRETLSNLNWNLATQASLLIFFIVFMAVLIRVVLQDKKEISELSEMALHDDALAAKHAEEGAAGHG